MGGWLSRKDVEEMFEAMTDQGMVEDGIARRVRSHLDADNVEYALTLLMEYRRSGH